MSYETLAFVLQILSALVFPLVGVIGWLAWKIRSNDLHHMEQTLTRIETKLDAHIDYHLNKGL